MNVFNLENDALRLYDVKDQLKQFVYDRSLEAFSVGDKARDAIDSGQLSGRLKERITFMREQFIERIGGLPACDTPLLPIITGTIQCEGFRIEKVVFESRPQTYVTCSLYIPNGIQAPNGAVLFLCGHFSEGRLHPNYQMVCQYLVQAGLVVLSMDPIGLGERLSYFEPKLQQAIIGPGTDEHEHAGSQIWPLGDGIVRYFLHDIIRAIDYMCTRPEIDPGKIGVTGNSGGGLQTGLAMFCDTRIAAAAPATYLMSRESYLFSGQPQDAEQVWPGMSALGFDHEDVLLAMAPRPVLVLAAQYDFFPIEGTRRTVERSRRFWDELGKSDNIEMFEDNCEHQYSVSMAKAATAFFAKHLLNGVRCSGGASIAPLEETALWCTASGQVRGDFPAARGVHEENIDRLDAIEAARKLTPENERLERAIAWLKQKVMEQRKPCAFNPRFRAFGRLDELEVQSCLWWSQEKLFNHAFLFRDYRMEQNRTPLTIALWERGTRKLQSRQAWLRKECSAGRTVMVLDVSGEGKLQPNQIYPVGPYEKFGTLHKLMTDLIWLADSIAALRSFDVMRAVEMAGHMDGIDKREIQIYAEGRFSIYALLAKVLDSDNRIDKLTVGKGAVSVGEWVRARYYDNYDVFSAYIPGMLKHFDIPDLINWTKASVISRN